MKFADFGNHVFALIVVGGGGTRLWPRSRNATPKQFLRLFGGKTLMQITAYRFAKTIPWERIFAVTTSSRYKREILREVPEMLGENVIYEPMRRSTAPAHGLGALYILGKDPDAVIVNDYSDHLMKPERVYLSNMKAAAAVAFASDFLMATGIRPTYPNVGYGYIKRGQRWGVKGGKTIFKAEKFTEKPPLGLAKKYLASGDYYWNAGQFIWRADAILKALMKYEPKVGEGLEKIGKVIGTKKERQVMEEEYKKMPDISIDYAVVERADNVLFLLADYAWTDVGDWKEVWESLPKDDAGNVIIDGLEPGGRVINLDTSDALIYTDGRLIAVVDVDNIVVVDTKDALLVCSKSKAQNVKKIVEQLKKEEKKYQHIGWVMRNSIFAAALTQHQQVRLRHINFSPLQVHIGMEMKKIKC